MLSNKKKQEVLGLQLNRQSRVHQEIVCKSIVELLFPLSSPEEPNTRYVQQRIDSVKRKTHHSPFRCFALHNCSCWLHLCLLLHLPESTITPLCCEEMDRVVGCLLLHLPGSQRSCLEVAHSQAHRLEEIEHNQKRLLILKLFSPRFAIERTFGVWKNRFAILRGMPKFKMETQVKIVVATMAIHNFIRRNAEIDIDFSCYEDENIALDSNDYRRPVNLDPSQILRTTSSSEMEHVHDSIRNQIIEYKQNN